MTSRLVRLASTPSTQDAAREMAAAGAAPFTMVMADEQTAGRGRSGRSWESRAGMGLYASLVMPAIGSDRLPALGLAAAVALLDAVRALAAFHPARTPGLKWPNDLLVPTWRKLAGVLVEARSDEPAIVGIGVNLTHREADLPRPGERALPATSILLETGSAPGREELALRVQGEIASRVAVLEERGFAALAPDWMARSILTHGDEIVVRDGVERIAGRFGGVDDNGALCVALAQGRRRTIYSGDIRLRPAGRSR